MGRFLAIIVEQFFLYAPLILGAHISFNVLGVPDFSIESAFIIGAICATKALPFVDISTVPTVIQLLLVCLISCLAGSLVGLVSSVCTRYLRLEHALSAIMTLGLFQGISYFLLGGGHQSLTDFYNPLKLIPFTIHSPELPTLFFVSTIFILLMHAFMTTQLGYCLAAYGYNNHFFKHYGISSHFIFIAGLMLSNASAGLSGYLVAQSNGYLDVSMGFGLPLMCLSVLMLGSLVTYARNTITLAVPLIGLICYLLVQQLLLYVGFTSLYFSTAQALIILLGTIIRRYYGISGTYR